DRQQPQTCMSSVGLQNGLRTTRGIGLVPVRSSGRARLEVKQARFLFFTRGEFLAVNTAMPEIEKHNPQLAGVLPRSYQIFNSRLRKELHKKARKIPASLDYDAFGPQH